jgi:hypothetical protein
VEGEWDLGFKVIFDDGSGTAFIKGDRTIVEGLTGRSMDEITREVKESLDPDKVLSELEEILVGRPMFVVADPIMDDYGIVLNIAEIEIGWDLEQLEREVISLMEVMA